MKLSSQPELNAMIAVLKILALNNHLANGGQSLRDVRPNVLSGEMAPRPRYRPRRGLDYWVKPRDTAL